MTVSYINGKFIVSSKSEPGKLYTVGKDLVCECKGYVGHKRCTHQKQIIEYIESGATVDIARIPVDVRYTSAMSALKIYNPERADRYEAI